MKNIDIKSLIIGILGTGLIFVTMGATNKNKNMGHITVNSITLVDENGERVGLLGSFHNKGMFSLNKAGKPSMVMISCDSVGGVIITFNADYKMTSYLGSGEGGSGYLQTFNIAGVETGYFGTDKDEDGIAILFNRYGDVGWAEEGKQ